MLCLLSTVLPSSSSLSLSRGVEEVSRGFEEVSRGFEEGLLRRLEEEPVPGRFEEEELPRRRLNSLLRSVAVSALGSSISCWPA